jgi:hypothetical protein
MICFRTAVLEDLPQILPIYENARAFMRQSGNPNQWRDHHPAVEILREDIQKGQLYLCLENEEIAAVFCYNYCLFIHLGNYQILKGKKELWV